MHRSLEWSPGLKVNAASKTKKQNKKQTDAYLCAFFSGCTIILDLL